MKSILTMLLLIVLVVCGCESSHSGEKTTFAYSDLRLLCVAANLFNDKQGYWPSKQADLLHPPVLSPVAGVRYIRKLVKDPWGNLVLQEVGKHGEPVYLCLGADGKPGGTGLNRDIRRSAIDGDFEENLNSND